MAEEGTQDWREEFEPESAKVLERFVEDDALDVKKMGDSYVELEKAYSSRIKIPDDGDVEGWQKLHTKLGRPEKAEDYELAVPEGMEVDNDYMGMMRNAFFEGGGSQKLWKTVAGRHLAYLAEAQKTAEQQGEALNTKRWERLKWDDAAKKENIELAKRVVADVNDEEISQFLTPEKIENDPLLVHILSHALKMSMDDTLIKGEVPTDDGWKPSHDKSPDMYAYGDDDDSRRARDWFRKRGHKYDRDD